MNEFGGVDWGQGTQVADASGSQAIVNAVLRDGHLTLSEANQIWRANTDPGLHVTIDAGQLTVTQTTNFNANGTAGGRVSGTDWLVHGSVTLSKDAAGNVSILPETYDFQPHGGFWDSPVRNFETYLGFWVASRGGISVGTDFVIQFSGFPNVTR